MVGAEVAKEDYINVDVNGVIFFQAEEVEDPWCLGGQEGETASLNSPL